MGFAGYLAALVAALALAPVSGAGMTSHVFVAYRTANYFGRISEEASPHNYSRYNAAIANNQPAVLGGADSPTSATRAAATTTRARRHTGRRGTRRRSGTCRRGPTGTTPSGRTTRRSSSPSSSARRCTTSRTSSSRGSTAATSATARCARVCALRRGRGGAETSETSPPATTHVRARGRRRRARDTPPPTTTHVRARGLFATRHDDPSWPHIRARGGGRHDEQLRLTWRVPHARQTFPPTAGISASDPRPRASSRRSVR